MARLSRAVVPGVPHHVTQRGNRRQRTFFGTDDYLLYLALMAEWCRRFDVDVWAYCLMPNHSHLITVPSTPDGLRRAISEAHRRYTAEINKREGWKGHLWQGRFASFAMDDHHTIAAARYIELNPVRAGLVKHAAEYPWSSARPHLLGHDDGLVVVEPLLSRVDDWSALIASGNRPHLVDKFQKHERTGRPLGNGAFVDRVEQLLQRELRPRRPGPPPGLTAQHAGLLVAPEDLICGRSSM